MPTMPGIYYQPPPPFLGGRQPYQQRKMSVTMLENALPSTGGQVWAVPNDGSEYPYAKQQRKLNPAQINRVPDAPQTVYEGRTRIYQAITRAWDPPPPNPHFARQPLQRRNLNPTVLNLVPSNPVFGHRGRTVQARTQIGVWWIPPPPQPPARVPHEVIEGPVPPAPTFDGVMHPVMRSVMRSPMAAVMSPRLRTER